MGYAKRHIQPADSGVRYVDVRCSDCGKPLEPAFPEDDKGWRHLQPKDGLVVAFEGGYGMYIDPVDDSPERVVLCEECADELVNSKPYLAAIFARFRS